jgi:hypothetical protein
MDRRSSRLGAWFVLATSALALAGCPTEPPKRAAEPKPPPDEWAGIPSSPEWLHATASFSGPHGAECGHALTWVRGEAKCEGAVCVHARDLAREWVQKCEAFSPTVAEVKPLVPQFSARAQKEPGQCAKELEALLRDGCKKRNEACMEEGQGWVTRCAHDLGSPLAVRMVERTVERGFDEPGKVTLDPRPCEELRQDVAKAAACDHRFKCEEALKLVDPYRERCQGEEQWPTMATAALELATLVGAQKPAEPIRVLMEPKTIAEGEVPLRLADGTGAALWVCDQRAADAAGYVDQRRACAGGKVSFARAFKVKGRYEVRAGTLDSPSDAVFAARFPSFAVTGEAAARDKAALAELGPALEKAAGGPKTEAAASIAKALLAKAPELRRSAGLRAALARLDDAVAPALRELGKAKVAAAKGRLSPVDLAGFAARAEDSVLADVGPDGAVRVGVPGPLDEVELASAWPKAVAEYRDAVKTLFKAAKGARATSRDAGLVRGFAEQQGQACGQAMKKARTAETSLIACGFGFDTCDEGKLATLGKDADDARAAAEDARGKALYAASSLGPARRDVLAAATAAGCVDPWW